MNKVMTVINKIPPKLKVCLSVFIIGLIILFISASVVSTASPVSIIFTVIGAVVTITGITALIIYWVEWADK